MEINNKEKNIIEQKKEIENIIKTNDANNEKTEINSSVDYDNIDPSISNLSKSICEIKKENGKETIINKGFLLKFYIDQEAFYCLISNEEMITNNKINNKDILNISYDNGLKKANIKMNK